MSRFSLPAQKDEPKVDPDALRAFAAGKERQGSGPGPTRPPEGAAQA
jgi:hypothetical protein